MNDLGDTGLNFISTYQSSHALEKHFTTCPTTKLATFHLPRISNVFTLLTHIWECYVFLLVLVQPCNVFDVEG